MSLKICVIGCGYISSSVHAPSYLKYAAVHGDLTLSACCDIDEDKARAYRMKFGFQRWYTDYVKMLVQERPDAVCVNTSERVTAKVAVKVMEMGFPLIIEKPPGRTREETIRMIEAARKNGVANQVAFNRRFIPLVRELKEKLSAAFRPEEIQNLCYDFYRVGRRDEDFADTAIHGIDTVRYLAGSDYSRIRFHYQELPQFGRNVANIFMDCEMKSGATARLNFCPVAGVVIERATVNTYDNTYFLNIPVWSAVDSPGRLLQYCGGKLVLDETGMQITDGTEMFEESGFYAENASFFNDIKAGRKPVNDISSGLQSVEVAECIRNRTLEYKA